MLISFLRKSRLSLPITPGKKKKKKEEKKALFFFIYLFGRVYVDIM